VLSRLAWSRHNEVTSLNQPIQEALQMPALESDLLSDPQRRFYRRPMLSER